MKAGRALFISAYLPSEEIPAAGNRLSGAALKDFASRFEVVDLVSFCNGMTKGYDDPFPVPAGVNTVLFDVDMKARLVAMVLHPFSPSGVAVRHYLARRKVTDLLSHHAYDEIFVDFTQGLGAIDQKLWPKVTLRLHDVMSQLYRRQAAQGISASGLIGKLELSRCLAWEPHALRRVGKLQALTAKDAALVRQLSGRDDAEVVPPSGFLIVEGRQPAGIDPNMILFWGNMGRKENVDAVLYFEKRILPAIREKVPNAYLVAAGANPPKSAMALTGPHVTWTGFVESPDEYFRRCAVGIAPLLSGAGIKIKVLEFIHSGIPTVASSVGAEGIAEHENLTTEDDPKLFAEACVAIMRGNNLRSGA
ncbi:glycosyltransferase family 4 protein [Tistrella mobilis]|uniref:Glycosyltransferase n=1 Tax=Tistrella mobilis (strain KA081020-065) TaxID=1110502 RepID=I3TIH3_TISMK|nr:glycosyltransferase [Tistrella mobilis]AFK52561.1 glycosyltransferase [Tistrella mobilis KA081020-065]